MVNVERKIVRYENVSALHLLDERGDFLGPLKVEGPLTVTVGRGGEERPLLRIEPIESPCLRIECKYLHLFLSSGA
jgi:hypothetical protein